MTGRAIIRASIPAAVFVATFLFRWVSVDFDNDYFMHVAWAAQMLRGEWPVRDFVEPGFILQTLLAYVGLRLGGYQLAWEAIVACTLIAASAVFVDRTCRRAGIPRWLTLAAVAVAVASYPRLYAYPKSFVYPAALWALAAYVDRPTRRLLLLLSGITALAFLFRHDHGAWIGIAVAASLMFVHYRRLSDAARALAMYGAVAVLLVSPWLAWVALSDNASQYVGFLAGQSQGLVTNRIVPDRTFNFDRSRPLVAIAPVEFPRVGVRWAPAASGEERQRKEARYGLQPLTGTDAYVLTNVDTANVRALVLDPAVEDTSGIDRGTLRVPGGFVPWAYLQAQRYAPIIRVRVLPGVVKSSNAQAWLTYVTFALPWLVLGLLLAAVTRRRTRPDLASVAFMAPAALLSIVTYQTLVRGSPDSRLGDVAPITALLLAWMSWRAWSVHRWPGVILKPIVLAVVMLTVAGAAAYGNVVGRLAGAGVDGPTNLVRRMRDVRSRYASRPLDVFAPPGAAGLPGLARWLSECTAGDDRVSVIGFEPQLFVVSERGFAAGMAFYDLAWASSDRDQRLAIDRWSRQNVPFVLAMASEWPAFASDYPRIREWIEQRYAVERRSTFGGNKELTILRDRSRRPGASHEATGLPCVAGHGKD